MERFFNNPYTLLSKREGPLGPYIDEFAQQLCDQGYSRQYARRRLQLVAELKSMVKTTRSGCLRPDVDASGELPRIQRSVPTHETW